MSNLGISDPCNMIKQKYHYLEALEASDNFELIIHSISGVVLFHDTRSNDARFMHKLSKSG